MRTDFRNPRLAWGTHDWLVEAGEFIRTLEHRQGLKTAAPEEVAYEMGYIGADELRTLAGRLGASGYGRYPAELVEAPRGACKETDQLLSLTAGQQ